jgi:hypothetical protein
MATGRVRVGWSKNPTHVEIDSGEKSDPHPYPHVIIQTRTHRVSGACRVCNWAGPI